jgi:hypothetical protein
MNISNWNHYHKFSETGKLGMAQTTYEPLINPEGTVFCANYNLHTSYHQSMGERPLYDQEVINWFFNNDIKNLEHFAGKDYAPEVLEIDYVNKRIFIKWYGNSCNHIVYTDSNWPLDWLEQLKDVMLDQINEGYYKLTMYSHCHYVTDQGQLKAIDWYGCVPIEHPLIHRKYMDAIIHESAKFRLDETGPLVGDYYNLEIMFKRGLQEHVSWGDKNLKFIHDLIFNK